jgi:predicted nucleic acid-binding protein
VSVIILDNEAVQALLSPRHPKHSRVAAYLDSQSQRARRRKDKARRWVPTTVRAEAGWDRTDPSAVEANRFHIEDRPLTADRANTAARIVALHGVSPADAHIGATVASADQQGIVVLTSDPGDIARICPPQSAKVIRI